MSKKYPAGPVNQHKSLATGESLAKASSEAKVGGSKKDCSKKTNK